MTTVNTRKAEQVLLRLRSATIDDARTVFAWRNDTWIVSLSASQRKVSEDEHARWFPEVLNRDKHLLFIIRTDAGIEAGTVRLDKAGEVKADITIYMLQPHTGRGLGVRALMEACLCAFAEWPLLRSIHAFIRQENDMSRKAFSKAGFIPADPSPDCPPGHCEMVLQRKP